MLSSPKPKPFDSVSSQYEEELAQGLALAGEPREYFARRRVEFLADRLRERRVRARNILDFGCGDGTATPYFADILGVESVVGVDASAACVNTARSRHGSWRAHFIELGRFDVHEAFSVAFCNGVFHHVPPGGRAAVASLILASVEPGGIFALWENNPWNPGARMVMRRIPFDRHAVMVFPSEARRLLAQAGFEVLETRYLFVFPHALQILRPAEGALARFPLGAQYQILARRPPRW